MYDRKCESGHLMIDCYEPVTAPVRVCTTCGAPTMRVLLPGTRVAAHGDEIDVEIKHGLCHDDGTPQRFRSRQAMKRAMRAKGWMPFVQHHDGSKNTQRWV